MHRSRLIALALVFVFACKSKNEAKTAEKTAELRDKKVFDVPTDLIYAGSAHLRVVDVAAGQAVSGIDLSRVITEIEFSRDGRRAFVAASDGVREIDAHQHVVLRKLSDHPARALSLGDEDRKLFVLEHEVQVQKNGAREVLPFRLVTIDLESGAVQGKEEIGQRIWAVIPPSEAHRSFLVVTEESEVRLGKAPGRLSGGEKIDLVQNIPSKTGLLVRFGIQESSDGRFAYIPVEGDPSRVLEVDLEKRAVRAFSLRRAARLRGAALSPDDSKLVVNALDDAIVLDVKTGEIIGELSLSAAHSAVAFGADGRRAYFAQTVDGTGGAITVVELEPLRVRGKIHLDDISPWVLAVRPRAEFASRWSSRF